jgi:hypothetical protein
MLPGTAQRPLDRRAVFIAIYRPVVALVLGRYEPAAIAGLGAIKLHLEDFSPPEEFKEISRAPLPERCRGTGSASDASA